MSLFIYLIIFIQAFRNIKVNPSTFIKVVIFSIIFLKFIILKIEPSFAGASSPFILLLLISLIPYLLLFKKIKFESDEIQLFIRITLFLMFTFVYFFLLSIFRNISPIIYLDFIRDYFYYLIIFFFIIIFKNKIDVIKLIKFIFLIFASQVILGFFQFLLPAGFADFFKIISYQWNDGTTYLLSPQLWNSKLVNGTMLRVAIFGNTIAIFSVYFFGKWVLRNDKYYSNIVFFSIIISSMFVVLFTGIRTSAFSLSVGILLILYYKNKKYFYFALSAMVALGFIYFQILINIGYEAIARNVDIENPFERLSGLVNVFTNIKYLDFQNSLTLGRSIILIEDFIKNPIIGLGQYWKDGYYGMLYYGSPSASWSDAAIMFHIVEFGLIGFALIISPFIFILNFSKRKLHINDYRIHLIVFIVIIIQTITDATLFAIHGSIIFILFLAVDLIKPHKTIG